MRGPTIVARHFCEYYTIYLLHNVSGKPWKLSCVEAFAAAYYICGFKEESELVLEKFKWGPNFLKLNHEMLEAYSSASTAGDVIKAQDALLQKFEEKSDSNSDTDLFDIDLNRENYNPNRAIHAETSSSEEESESSDISDNGGDDKDCDEDKVDILAEQLSSSSVKLLPAL